MKLFKATTTHPGFGTKYVLALDFADAVLAVNELWDNQKETTGKGGYYGNMEIEKIELMPWIDNIDLLFKV